MRGLRGKTLKGVQEAKTTVATGVEMARITQKE